MQISDYFNPSPSPLTNLSDKNNMNYYMNFSFLAKNQEKLIKLNIMINQYLMMMKKIIIILLVLQKMKIWVKKRMKSKT